MKDECPFQSKETKMWPEIRSDINFLFLIAPFVLGRGNFLASLAL